MTIMAENDLKDKIVLKICLSETTVSLEWIYYYNVGPYSKMLKGLLSKFVTDEIKAAHE